MQLTNEQLAEIKERCEKATPGPWSWSLNTEAKRVVLEASGGMRAIVMAFRRWGMGGASPVFRRNDPLMILDRADAFAKDITGREHHASWFRDIDHPDAQFIAHARTDIPALLAQLATVTRERDEVRAENERLKAERNAHLVDLRDVCRHVGASENPYDLKTQWWKHQAWGVLKARSPAASPPALALAAGLEVPEKLPKGWVWREGSEWHRELVRPDGTTAGCCWQPPAADYWELWEGNIRPESPRTEPTLLRAQVALRAVLAPGEGEGENG